MVVPPPVGVGWSARGWSAGGLSGGGGSWATTPKMATTLRAAVMETVHVPVPVQSPSQPANAEPDAGVAVSVTEVPSVKVAEQVAPQLMPAGLLVTVPLPCFPTVSVRMVGVEDVLVKGAVTLRAALIVVVHVSAVPEQLPLQPEKDEPLAGLAVSVTVVPLL